MALAFHIQLVDVFPHIVVDHLYVSFWETHFENSGYIIFSIQLLESSIISFFTRSYIGICICKSISYFEESHILKVSLCPLKFSTNVLPIKTSKTKMCFDSSTELFKCCKNTLFLAMTLCKKLSINLKQIREWQ